MDYRIIINRTQVIRKGCWIILLSVPSCQFCVVEFLFIRTIYLTPTMGAYSMDARPFYIVDRAKCIDGPHFYIIDRAKSIDDPPFYIIDGAKSIDTPSLPQGTVLLLLMLIDSSALRT